MSTTLEKPVRRRPNPVQVTSTANSGKLANALKVLADATRLRIVRMLARHGEMNVNKICEQLGLSQPLISHHLALLRVANLIDVRRDGKFNFYYVRNRELQSLVDQFSDLFNSAEENR